MTATVLFALLASPPLIMAAAKLAPADSWAYVLTHPWEFTPARMYEFGYGMGYADAAAKDLEADPDRDDPDEFAHLTRAEASRLIARRVWSEQAAE